MYKSLLVALGIMMASLAARSQVSLSQPADCGTAVFDVTYSSVGR